MNREIKFRGRPTGKGGVWMIGIGAYKTHTAEHLVLNAKGDSVEVVHLCQYTGLKDKNGKEIYEGDVIESRGFRHIVEYDAKQARFSAKNINYHRDDGSSITQQWIDECEKVVIGNIYNNPELIKQ